MYGIKSIQIQYTLHCKEKFEIRLSFKISVSIENKLDKIKLMIINQKQFMYISVRLCKITKGRTTTKVNWAGLTLGDFALARYHFLEPFGVQEVFFALRKCSC